jgi:hypothetical protein
MNHRVPVLNQFELEHRLDQYIQTSEPSKRVGEADSCRTVEVLKEEFRVYHREHVIDDECVVGLSEKEQLTPGHLGFRHRRLHAPLPDREVRLSLDFGLWNTKDVGDRDIRVRTDGHDIVN